MDTSGLKDDFSVRETLIRRFGETRADRLLDVYEKNWITDADFEQLNRLHVNVVRLPFWYRNVESEDGTWRVDAFARLDWVVEHAWRHGIYTILDLHGVPGGQCGSDTTGRVRKQPSFWVNPSEQDRANNIWNRVAKHFAGNPAVAAYDLLNEPIGAPGLDQLWAVYDRFYKTVRRADPQHMITVEGCWGGQVDGKYLGWELNVLPPPEKFGWTNVVYQAHSYEWDWNNLNKQLASVENVLKDVENHRSWNVPVYVGEFNMMAQEKAWDAAVKKFSAAGIHWTIWSYKATHGTDSDSWGVINPKQPMPAKPDIQHNSADEIEKRWVAWNTEDAFAVNPMLERVLISR